MMNKTIELKQLTGVDIFKFIMAFAVVAIHVSAVTKPLPELLEYFVNLAVPFFFITSGFLVARKIETMKANEEVKIMFRKRSLQLFRIFGVWLLIYLPITIYHNIDNPKPLWRIAGGYVANIFFSGESYMAWPLWFIYSMAIVFLIFSFVNISKRKNIALLFLLFISVPIIGWMNSHFLTPYIAYTNKLIHRIMGGVFIFW